MAYVTVKGGQKAIREAEKLLEYFRCKGGSTPVDVKQIMDQMRSAVDRVMGEGALYAPELAALALKQAEGDPLEASFILRAFPSTLPRNLYSTVDTCQMQVIRRISAVFKDIPGGQYLGPTTDYVKRLFRFDLLEEDEGQVADFVRTYESSGGESLAEIPVFPKVVDLLRQQGLLEERKNTAGQTIVDDITRESLRFPASRSARLQCLARGETGAMMSFAYSSIRGYGDIHPYLGELRVGYVDLCVPHPIYEGEVITAGKVLVTEAEIIACINQKETEAQPKLTLGYGFCFGQNEIKAIAMGILDRCMETENPKAPAEDEEFVLYHIDGIEASGFTSHWKLPHYVDFQSDLNWLRSIQKRRS